MLCGGDKASGWIFTLDASGYAAHANIKKNGEYRELVCDASGFRPGQWNSLRLNFCLDGTMSLALNGRELGQGLKMEKAPQPFGVRSIGLRADLSGGQKF